MSINITGMSQKWWYWTKSCYNVFHFFHRNIWSCNTTSSWQLQHYITFLYLCLGTGSTWLRSGKDHGPGLFWEILGFHFIVWNMLKVTHCGNLRFEELMLREDDIIAFMVFIGGTSFKINTAPTTVCTYNGEYLSSHVHNSHSQSNPIHS